MLAALLVTGTLMNPMIDSPWYMNKAARDSAAIYRGHVEAYHQEFYSYDWAHTFAMLPIAGEWYVDKTATGIRYSVARALAVALSTVGTVRTIKGSPNLGLNIGMIAGGIIGYIWLKADEISDVMHTTSERDEALVEKWGIQIPDIMPGSIRYPKKQWPDWITKGPDERHPQDAREAVDKPLPSASK